MGRKVSEITAELKAKTAELKLAKSALETRQGKRDYAPHDELASQQRIRGLERRIDQLRKELRAHGISLVGEGQHLTWLHLSDLHFRVSGAGGHDALEYDTDVVLSALLHDITERIAEDELQPDLIFVTGDIAFSGKAEEYDRARSFFEDLLGRTGVKKERLFLVPGNQDADRARISPAAKIIGKKLTDRGMVNAILDHAGDRAIMLDRFDGYKAFVNDYLGQDPPFDDDHYFYVRLLHTGGGLLALMGLNSAWTSSGDEDDQGRLAIGERQVRRALELAKDADLKIALLHHPLTWLRGFEQAGCVAMLMGNCDLILHGHLHQVDLLQTRGPGSKARIIGAGACYEGRDRLNSYNWVRLHTCTRRSTVYLRVYSDRRGGFGPLMQ